MKERQPKHGATICIALQGGMIGTWHDDLYPDQAYFLCHCDQDTYDLDLIDYWMGITLPKLPKDESSCAKAKADR